MMMESVLVEKKNGESKIMECFTAEWLSKLLLSRGPLAIRHINHAVSEELEDFKSLSASKQRRMIMNLLEQGDAANSVVFEKIGWGQWNAKKVERDRFDIERKLTNEANAKMKDSRTASISGPSTTVTAGKIESGTGTEDKPFVPIGNQTVFIDENAVDSDDDEEGDDEEDERAHAIDERTLEADASIDYDSLYSKLNNYSNGISYRRRNSAISDLSPEEIEQELIAQKLRPYFRMKKNRRSSSRHQLPVTNATGRVDLENQLASNKNNLATATTAAVEPKARRESRLSISKESNIRSTLLPFKNYQYTGSKSSSRKNSISNPTAKISPLLASPDTSDTSHNVSQSSETDEEDWQSIGAESLRKNLSQPTTAKFSNKTNDCNSSSTEKQANPKEEKSAAFLLMSLKS